MIVTVPVGQRIDVFLASQEGINTRSAAQKLIADGHVRLNGLPVPKSYKGTPGELLDITFPEPVPSQALPEDISLDIVFEDAHLVVINKPRGLVVHPGAGNWTGTLVNALLHHCQGSLAGIGGVLRPGIVHRIDKDTTGLLVVAKSDTAYLGLQEQIANRNMQRIYHAICFGIVKEATQTINTPIGRHPTQRKKMAVHVPTAKTAVTHIKVLEYLPKHSLVEAQLETGRTHQIRVHMASINHPILGDATYTNRQNPKGIPGQMLHATKLAFTHPITGESMDFTAPWPECFAAAYERVK